MSDSKNNGELFAAKEAPAQAGVVPLVAANDGTRNETPLADMVEVLTEHGASAGAIVQSIRTAETALVATRKPVEQAPIEFDWDEPGVVVIEEQPRTACYDNAHGHVVVRQHSWPDEDQYITVAPGGVVALARRMLEVAGFGRVGFYSENGMACQDIEDGDVPQSVEKAKPKGARR